MRRGSTEVEFMKATCPECGAEIELPEDIENDEVIVCYECGAECRVIKQGNKVFLELIQEEEDEYFYDEFEDYEDEYY